MAKHDRDPDLRELIRSVDEAGQSVVSVTVAVHGTVLHGSLIAEERYFAELADVNPLMNALNPRAGLLGNDYEKIVDPLAAVTQHTVQQVTGRADERVALLVLLVARLLGDQRQACVQAAFAKHRRGRPLVKVAARVGRGFPRQFHKGGHVCR
jgi:hypothetical protein